MTSHWTPERGPGRVIGVIGGCGGAGATVFSAALALTAACTGPALLVDLDPWGGGIDLALGAEDQPGLRWPDLAALRGRLPPGLLEEGLPRAGPLPFLTWARSWSTPPGVGPPAPEASSALLRAARERAVLVVVDLPRQAPAAVLAGCDDLVLVVPATLRALAAARVVAARVRESGVAARLVLRGRSPFVSPSAPKILGLPVLAALPAGPALAAALERGGMPGRRETAVCRTVLAGTGSSSGILHDVA